MVKVKTDELVGEAVRVETWRPPTTIGEPKSSAIAAVGPEASCAIKVHVTASSIFTRREFDTSPEQETVEAWVGVPMTTTENGEAVKESPFARVPCTVMVSRVWPATNEKSMVDPDTDAVIALRDEKEPVIFGVPKSVLKPVVVPDASLTVIVQSTVSPRRTSGPTDTRPRHEIVEAVVGFPTMVKPTAPWVKRAVEARRPVMVN